MRTLTRIMLILVAALVVAGGLLALEQTAWATSAAEAVITANQATMTARYDAYTAAGAQPATGGRALATAGNLARLLVVAAAVVGGRALLDRRARAGRKGRVGRFPPPFTP